MGWRHEVLSAWKSLLWTMRASEPIGGRWHGYEISVQTNELICAHANQMSSWCAYNQEDNVLTGTLNHLQGRRHLSVLNVFIHTHHAGTQQTPTPFTTISENVTLCRSVKYDRTKSEIWGEGYGEGDQPNWPSPLILQQLQEQYFLRYLAEWQNRLPLRHRHLHFYNLRLHWERRLLRMLWVFISGIHGKHLVHIVPQNSFTSNSLRVLLEMIFGALN